MLELRRHADETIWLRDPASGLGPFGSGAPTGAGQVRTDLVAGIASVESRFEYQRLAADNGVGLPASAPSACSLVSALAPTTETGGVRLGAHLRAGVAANDHRCVQGRTVLSTGARLDVPVRDATLGVFGNVMLTGRGSPFAGSPSSRQANRRIELGFDLVRAVTDGVSERLGVAAFEAHDRESVSSDAPLGVRTTGVSVQYERTLTPAAQPGSELGVRFVAEGRLARVEGQRPTTEAAAIVRVRVNY